MKKKIKKSRGYRLYPETIKQINKIQKLLRTDSDKAISCACTLFLEHFSKKSKVTKISK